MRSLVKYLALALLLVAGTAQPALGQNHYYFAGGVCLPDHASASFTGETGWNASLGLERNFAPPAEWIAEASFTRVPAPPPYSGVFPLGSANDLTKPFTFTGPAARLTSVALGLRLHGPLSRVQNYAEALLGVANIRSTRSDWTSPSVTNPKTETNLMLGIGTGVRMLPFASAGLFADVHYQFLLSGAGAPVVPIRIGLVTR